MCPSFLFDQRKVFETVEVYISKVSFILYCTFSLNAPPSMKTGQPSGHPVSHSAFLLSELNELSGTMKQSG